jgi:hypothetical protein
VLSCGGMSRAQVFVRYLLLPVALLLCGQASAETRLEQLLRRLSQAEDFRVRTQAALALGASGDKRAVSGLCAALNDASTTVRAASAAGLGKLARGGAECLEQRLGRETSDVVKASIKKALNDVASGAGEAEDTLTKDTKIYVAIDKTVDGSGKPDGAMDELVRKAMTRTAKGAAGFAIAPKDESLAQAKKKLAKFKRVRGFLLSPRVEKPRYANGNLMVKIDVAIFTYPTRNLKGSVGVPLTQQGVDSRDPQSEIELIEMAAERAMEKFSQRAEDID